MEANGARHPVRRFEVPGPDFKYSRTWDMALIKKKRKQVLVPSCTHVLRYFGAPGIHDTRLDLQLKGTPDSPLDRVTRSMA